MNTTPTPTVVDLTGLPEPVVRSICQLVAELKQAAPPTPPTPPASRPPLRGRLTHPAPEYTAEMMKRDRMEAWANFPRELPEAGDS